MVEVPLRRSHRPSVDYGMVKMDLSFNPETVEPQLQVIKSCGLKTDGRWKNEKDFEELSSILSVWNSFELY
jgi:hypothetical protein